MPQKQHVIHGRDHLPRGADPIPGLIMAPGGDTLDEKILALAPAGFWKLDESSGSIAQDSSGFDQDLSTALAELDPLWGQPAGPPGTQAASFDHGTGGPSGTATASRVSRSWPVLSGSFTAGIWVSRNTTAHSMVIGQGNPLRSGGKGWSIDLQASSESPALHPALYFGISGGTDVILALNPLPVDTWAFLAVSHNADTDVFKLYVDGLLQDEADGSGYVPTVGASPLWIGHDGGLGHDIIPTHFVGSYGFLVNRVVTGGELVDLVTPSGAETAGQVPISDGAGGSSWGYVDTGSLADEAVTPDKVEPGTEGYSLRTVGGDVVWALPTVRVNY